MVGRTNCLALFIACFTLVIAVDFPFVHIQEINESELEDFKNHANVRLVYYYVRDIPRLRLIFKELDKSAQKLNPYGVEIALLDCNEVKNVATCKEKRVEHNIYVYKQGFQMVDLELDTMFDVNSILSNVLQLVLLREVPVIQSLRERQQHEKKYKGATNIIYSYQKAIGTFEHRIFMEVAFVYHEVYQFAFSTSVDSVSDLEGVDDETDAQIWVLECKDAVRDEPCPSMLYKGDMDLASLAQFCRGLGLPKVHYVSEDDGIPFDSSMHQLMLFVDNRMAVVMKQTVDALIDQFHGLIGLSVVNTDEVDALKVTGLADSAPGMVFTSRVEQVVTHSPGSFTPQGAVEFVFNLLQDYHTAKPTDPGSPETVIMPPTQHAPGSVEDVESQDDIVAAAVFRLRKTGVPIIAHDHVMVLTDKTFPVSVNERALLMVLFYLPLDSRNVAFLRAYGEAALTLHSEREDPLATVNCQDWTDVCSQQNITIYPTIKVFKHGQSSMFKGPLDQEFIVSAVSLLQQPSPVPLASVEDAESFIQGSYHADAGDKTGASILGLFTTDSGQEYRHFSQAAASLHGKHLFGKISGEVAMKMSRLLQVEPPAIVAFRHNDPYKPRVVFDGDFSLSDIEEFSRNSGVAVLPELTPLLFPQLYAKKQPFLVLFLDSTSESVKDAIAGIADSAAFPDMVFCWMQADDVESLGRSILSQYDNVAILPAISVVYLQKGDVYNYKDTEDLSSKAISSWLKEVTEDRLKPSKMLSKGNWKPSSPGYNFLEIMDREGDSRYSVDDSDIAEYHEDSEGEEADSESMDSDDGDDMPEMEELKNSRLYHQKDKKQAPKNDQINEPRLMEHTEL